MPHDYDLPDDYFVERDAPHSAVTHGCMFIV
jgi:hypothetical protein